MAATKFGVVYGTASKIIQRIIDPSGDADDSALTIAAGNLAPGESMQTFLLANFPVRNARTMQAQIGTPAHSGRCAVVVNGTVTNVVMADPLLYTPPAGSLVQTDVAGIGWNYNPASAIAKFTVSVAIVTNGTVTSISAVAAPSAAAVPIGSDVLCPAPATLKVGDAYP